MEKILGRVGCIIWRFKNRPHIYIFDEKFLWIRDSFLHYDFGIFLHVLYAYYAERKFCHKYTHALSPVWNRPPHIRALYARKISPPDIYEDCGAFEIGGRLIGCWYLCVRLCFVLYMRSSFGWGRFFWLVDAKTRL